MRLNRGATTLALGDIAGKVVGFLLLPYITSSLEVAEYGLLSLYLAVIQILIVVFSFCGNGLIPIKYAQDGPKEALFYRGVTLRLGMFMLLFSIAIAWLIDQLNVFEMGGWLVYVMVCFVAAVQSINAINLSYLRSDQEFGVAAFGQFFVSILSVSLTVAFFEFYQAGVSERLLATALSFLAIQLMYQFWARGFSPAPSISPLMLVTRARDKALEVVLYGGSLFMHHASFWLKSYLDRFVILNYLSVTQVGIYSLSMQLNSIVILVFTVVSQACQPFIYKYLAAGDWVSIKKMRYLYSCAVLAFAISGYVFLQFTFPYFFDEKYKDSLELFNILLLGSALHSLYFIFSQSIFFRKKNTLISRITFGSMFVHICALILSVQAGLRLEYMCYAYVVSSLVACIVTVYCSYQIERELK